MIALFLLCSCFFESVSGQSFELAWHSEIGLNKIPKNGCWCCWTIITQKAPVRANNQVGAVPITQSIWGKGGRWGTIIVVMVWTWRYDSDIRYCHWKTLSQRLPETICLSKNDISLYHKTRTTDSLLVCLLYKPHLLLSFDERAGQKYLPFCRALPATVSVGNIAQAAKEEILP